MYFEQMCGKHNKKYNAIGSYCPDCMRESEIAVCESIIKQQQEYIKNLKGK